MKDRKCRFKNQNMRVKSKIFKNLISFVDHGSSVGNVKNDDEISTFPYVGVTFKTRIHDL